MFIHLLPKDNVPFGIIYSSFSKRHYLKNFEKNYPGKQWPATNESIFEDLSRITYMDNDLQQTQQVDELWHKDEFWIFKYDFKIAGKSESTKGSGNRCILFLDLSKKIIEILIIYCKGDLPKNMNETQYISTILSSEFAEHINSCK